ncbi:hypothetical protein [Lactiplantibacillus plantarum]|uniref:hypothetical protein n=1 Tax=Lactiplantibacillus plantarum TaxID=1590 RepID=UPI00070E791B|nr:hypothetical protein [Lactiplantibacillus plantarum]KRN36244.1 hypothetical protein IV39_GL000649 [Lactiplantibacillus plantarum]
MAEITDKVVKFPADSDNSDFSDGGGTNMSKYVTHEELAYETEKIMHRIELLDHDMENKFNTLPDKFEITLNRHDEKQRKEHSETQRFIIGTLLIGSASLIVGIIALFV